MRLMGQKVWPRNLPRCLQKPGAGPGAQHTETPCVIAGRGPWNACCVHRVLALQPLAPVLCSGIHQPEKWLTKPKTTHTNPQVMVGCGVAAPDGDSGQPPSEQSISEPRPERRGASVHCVESWGWGGHALLAERTVSPKALR